MSEIEQGTVAGFALVARHDLRLGAATGGDRLFTRDSAREYLAMMSLQPVEQLCIAQHAVFGDFGVARAELPWRQRIEHRRIGDHQHRLMKRADKILAVRRIDTGLAADRRIDLRQQ